MLKDYINMSGLKLSYIADCLGIKYNTLMSKLSNRRDFKLTEIMELCKLLNIDNDTREVIFFANLVDRTPTEKGD